MTYLVLTMIALVLTAISSVMTIFVEPYRISKNGQRKISKSAFIYAGLALMLLTTAGSLAVVQQISASRDRDELMHHVNALAAFDRMKTALSNHATTFSSFNESILRVVELCLRPSPSIDDLMVIQATMDEFENFMRESNTFLQSITALPESESERPQ